MMTSSNGNIFRLLALCVGNSPVSGEFPAQRPVTRSFDVFLDLRLTKRLSKQSWGWWFETPSRPSWRHNNVEVVIGPETYIQSVIVVTVGRQYFVMQCFVICAPYLSDHFIYFVPHCHVINYVFWWSWKLYDVGMTGQLPEGPIFLIVYVNMISSSFRISPNWWTNTYGEMVE